jgi:hypothetical protein
MDDDDLGLVYHAADDTWRILCRLCEARSAEGFGSQDEALADLERHMAEFHPDEEIVLVPGQRPG